MPSPYALDDLVSLIAKAWTQGRRVVPVVGAGLSADSGFPIITQLSEYLAKLHVLIKQVGYLPGDLRTSGADKLAAFRKKSRADPAHYVGRFGWPDRNDLNQDLAAHFREVQEELRKEGASPDEAAAAAERRARAAVDRAYDAVLRMVNPVQSAEFDTLHKEAVEAAIAAVPGLTVPQRAELRRGIRRRFKRTRKDAHQRFELLNDWRQVLHHFTAFQQDYADALFHHLAVARQPNAGHRYLAFLVKLLSCRTVFTFNFDDLIEQALDREGVDYVAFAMEHGASLPTPRLVADATAVVKMHGGTHGLLLDERLSRPVTDEYARRFRELVGRDPVILVLGTSGETRLLDLLGRMMGEGAEVAWLHFGPEPEKPVQALARRWESRWRTAPTRSIGYSLQQVYAGLAGRNPVSAFPYTVGVSTPIFQPRRTKSEAERKNATEEERKAAAEERSRSTGIDGLLREVDAHRCLFVETKVAEGEFRRRTSSEDLVDLAARWIRRGPVVWVNLEALHTLAAVVGTIVAQCNRYDPSLPPVALTYLDKPEDGNAIAAAVDRVVDALGRGRYLLVMDGLEAYEWLPYAHHRNRDPRIGNSDARLGTMEKFLIGLRKERRRLNASRAVLGRHEDPAANRHRGGVDPFAGIGWDRVEGTAAPSDGRDALLAASPGEPFVRLAPGITTALEAAYRREPDLPPGGPDPGAKWSVAMALVTAARRARSMVMIRELLRPAFPTKAEFAAAVVALTEPSEAVAPLTAMRLDGGGLWLTRSVRNAVYEANARHARDEATFARLLPADGVVRDVGPADYRASVGQAFGLFCVHQRLARIVLSQMFLPSQDAWSFVEYVYHRLSALRYLNKLVVLADPPGPTRPLNDRGGFAAGLESVRGMFEAAFGETAKDFLGFVGATHGLFPNEGTRTLPEYRGVLDGIRVSELQALGRAWAENEMTLRTQIPPPQLQFCCGVLVAPEIPDRLRTVTIKDGRGGPVATFTDDTAWQGAVDAFARTVLDFRVKVLYENGDYWMAAETRAWNLVDGHVREDLPETPPREARRARWDLLLRRVVSANESKAAGLKAADVHALIDTVICATHLDRQDGTDVAPPEDVAKEVRDLAAGIETHCARRLAEAKPDCPAEELADWHEALLRLNYFTAELLLGPSVFTHPDGFDGSAGQQVVPEATGGIDPLTRCDDQVEQGLERVRVAPPRPDGRPRSLIFDATPGGSLYLPFRAALSATRGRLTWLRAVREHGRGNDPETTVALNRAFDDAFKHFDSARVGLHGVNRGFALTNELYRVEACLARARLALHPYKGLKEEEEEELRTLKPAVDGSATKPDTAKRMRELVGLARAKYETARTALKLARGHLLTGRRNIIGWRLFYALAAQFHADRLALMYLDLLLHVVAPDATTDVPEAGGVPPDAEVYNRIRKGYAALRMAFDVAPPGAGEPSGYRRWLRRTWREITTFGYATSISLPGSARDPFAKSYPADKKVKQAVTSDQVFQLLGFLRHRTRLSALDELRDLWSRDDETRLEGLVKDLPEIDRETSTAFGMMDYRRQLLDFVAGKPA